MEELFVKVSWPEIQDFQTDEYVDRYEEEIDFSAETNCWFVPLSFYNEVNAKKTLIIDKDGPVKINDLISVVFLYPTSLLFVSFLHKLIVLRTTADLKIGNFVQSRISTIVQSFRMCSL